MNRRAFMSALAAAAGTPWHELLCMAAGVRTRVQVVVPGRRSAYDQLNKVISDALGGIDDITWIGTTLCPIDTMYFIPKGVIENMTPPGMNGHSPTLVMVDDVEYVPGVWATPR